MDEEQETSRVQYDEIKAETFMAYLFVFDDIEEWLPKSHCCEIDEENKTVVLPDWLVSQRGLDDWLC